MFCKVRLDLGDVDIGTKAAEVFARGGSVRDLVDVLDLSQVDNRLRGADRNQHIHIPIPHTYIHTNMCVRVHWAVHLGKLPVPGALQKCLRA